MAKKEKKEVKLSKDKTSFMKSFKAELKKVIWPTPKQLFNNTVAVISIVIITAMIVFILDFAFESMNKFGIDRVKQLVTNSENQEENNESSEENSNEEDNQDGESNEDVANSESSNEESIENKNSENLEAENNEVVNEQKSNNEETTTGQ